MQSKMQKQVDVAVLNKLNPRGGLQVGVALPSPHSRFPASPADVSGTHGLALLRGNRHLETEIRARKVHFQPQGTARTGDEGRAPAPLGFIFLGLCCPWPRCPPGGAGLASVARWLPGLARLRPGDALSSRIFSLSRNLVSREQDLEKGRPGGG